METTSILGKAPILEGLGEGLSRSGKSLNRWWQQPPKGLEASLESVSKLIQKAVLRVQDQKLPINQPWRRCDCWRLVSFRRFANR